MENLDKLPGSYSPLGATLTESGVNFAVFSRNATAVSLEFFSDENSVEPCAKIDFDPVENRTGDVWHCFVPNMKAGALYLYRVDGPFEPEKGLRFNRKQRLFDPYAKAITATSVFYNLPPNYAAALDKVDVELQAESKNLFPKCVIVDNNNFDWQGDKPINRPLSESVIYEVHVKGFTAGKNAGVSCPGS